MNDFHICRPLFSFAPSAGQYKFNQCQQYPYIQRQNVRYPMEALTKVLFNPFNEKITLNRLLFHFMEN